MADGLWEVVHEVAEDYVNGYAYAIATGSSAILSLYQQRCLAAAAAAPASTSAYGAADAGAAAAAHLQQQQQQQALGRAGLAGGPGASAAAAATEGEALAPPSCTFSIDYSAAFVKKVAASVAARARR